MNRGAKQLLPASFLALLLAVPTILSAQLPPSKAAPKVGEKAPDFTLPDSLGKPVKLSDLYSGASTPRKGSWVLLVFYRGYW